MKTLQRLAGMAVAAAMVLINDPTHAAQFDGVTVRFGTFGGKWR